MGCLLTSIFENSLKIFIGRPFSISRKEFKSNNNFKYFVEVSDVHDSCNSQNVIQLKLLYK